MRGADEAPKRTAPLLTKDAGVLYNVGRKGSTFQGDSLRFGFCPKPKTASRCDCKAVFILSSV